MSDITLSDQRQSYASKKERLCREMQNYMSFHKFENGAPERIRTSDPLIRSQVLYPAELRVRSWGRFSCSAAPMQALKLRKMALSQYLLYSPISFGQRYQKFSAFGAAMNQFNLPTMATQQLC